MGCEQLKIHTRHAFQDARMVLGFSGWMDGGEVSTGTIGYLVETLKAREFAEIEPGDFYVYNVPGAMDVAALFRPHTKIENGLITELEVPRNTFYASEDGRLILFLGKEPNLKWIDYADCIFSLASEFGVRTICFVGSVAGMTPHTREPRLFGSVSEESLKPSLELLGVRFTNYEGPASIITLLTHLSAAKGIRMTSLYAEVPAYVQGKNPRGIESVARRLAVLLDLPLKLDGLRKTGDAYEKRLNELIESRAELATLIKKLEEDYDNEVFNTEMGDLKDWLEQQGVRLD